MAFKLAPKNEIKMSVIVYELQDDDKVEQSKINVTYNRLKKQEWQDLTKDILDEDVDFSWFDALRKNVKDVGPLVDAEGKEIKYTSKVLEELLAYQPTFDALLGGFVELNNGMKEAERRKNSKKRAGIG